MAEGRVGERLSFHYTFSRTSDFYTMGIVTSGTLEQLTLLYFASIIALLYYHMNKLKQHENKQNKMKKKTHTIKIKNI